MKDNPLIAKLTDPNHLSKVAQKANEDQRKIMEKLTTKYVIPNWLVYLILINNIIWIIIGITLFLK